MEKIFSWSIQSPRINEKRLKRRDEISRNTQPIFCLQLPEVFEAGCNLVCDEAGLLVRVLGRHLDHLKKEC